MWYVDNMYYVHCVHILKLITFYCKVFPQTEGNSLRE